MKNNLLIYWISLLIISLSIFSCEELVELEDLNYERVVVIDAKISNEEGNVLMTYTAPFQTDQDYEVIENAGISILSGDSSRYFLNHIGEGVYKGDAREWLAGGLFELKVNVADEGNFSALAVMPLDPKIDSSKVIFRDNDEDFEDGYYISFYLDPIQGRTGYYTWDWFVEGVGEIQANKVPLASDFDRVNGSVLIESDFPFFEGEKVIFKLRSISEATFQYYQSLNLLIEGENPAQLVSENPPSNLVGEEGQEVVGIFSMESVLRDTILILDPNDFEDDPNF